MVQTTNITSNHMQYNQDFLDCSSGSKLCMKWYEFGFISNKQEKHSLTVMHMR